MDWKYIIVSETKPILEIFPNNFYLNRSMKFLLYVSGRPDLSCPKVGSRYPPDKSLFSAAWIVQEVSPLLIRWIVIYPVDNAIQLMNNRDLSDTVFLRFSSES